MNSTRTAIPGIGLALRPAPRFSYMLTLVGGIVLFLVVGLFHVWSRVAILEEGYALSRQRTRIEELNQERKSLTLDLARLRDPARLEAAARTHGFGPPQPGQIVLLEEAR